MSEKFIKPWWYWFYQLYKWPVFLPLMIVNTIFCAVFAALVSILVNPRIGSYFGMLWARITCWIAPVRVKIHGQKNFERGQSYVIVANHQTGFDIFLLYAYLGIDFKWLMKKELRKMPLVGYASEKVGHIFVDRSSPMTAVHSLEEARHKLKKGTSVIIFPEGARSGREEMLPFKRGAFKLALELELPVLPVTIVNSWRIKRPGFWNIVPGRAALVIHSPVNTCDYKDRPEELRDVIRRTIQTTNDGSFARIREYQRFETEPEEQKLTIYDETV